GQVRDLQKIHARLLGQGEYPDFPAALALFGRLGQALAANRKMVEFRWLAEQAQDLPGGDGTTWRLLNTLSSIGMSYSEENQAGFLKAIEEAFQNNWTDILWLLMRETKSSALPAWYPEVSKMLRVMQLEIEPGTPAPLEAAVQFSKVLESELRPVRETFNVEETTLFSEPIVFVGSNEKNRLMQAWLNKLRNEILPRWKEVEPPPPFSGLDYRDVALLSQEIAAVYPTASRYLERSIYQPSAQIRIILDAWERKEFEVMNRALRRLLLWDPERLRVLRVIELMETVQPWLDALAQGPVGAEGVLAYGTRHEVVARDLRSRIGPATWLDRLLGVLKLLRQGGSAAQAAREQTEVYREMPWLRDHIAGAMPNPPSVEAARRSRLPADEGAVRYNLDRKPKNHMAEQFFHGFKESVFGPEGDLTLDEPLDLWKPEAQGSSARVFLGFVRLGDDQLRQRAIKIMRPNQVEYALPLFMEEVRV
ncbi:MAG: hypothetical protein AAGU05_10955, partial [Anaerolineaceae bacterium]